MAEEHHNGHIIAPELIEAQLQRIRSSAHFCHSQRYPRFLDYVVSRTIHGRQEDLKERTIGVEAFGRKPEYDLNADPIVRVTAGEVRKRLAQYYYEPEHQSELRIEMRSGSYVPEFRYQTAGATEQLFPALAETTIAVDAEPISTDPEADLPAQPVRPAGRLLPIAAVLAILAVIAVSFGLYQRANAPWREFWQPVLANPGQVTLAVGSVTVLNPPLSPTGPSPESVGIHPLFADPVALSDTIAVSNLQRILYRFSRVSSIQSSTLTNFSDLQKGPVILVSGFNNPWTMRLTSSLRIQLHQVSVDTYQIVDHSDPGHKHWDINTRTRFNLSEHDYGLVARFRDPTTEQTVVVVAGIGENGTIAASELISDDRYLRELKDQGLLPRPNQNWEAVIETRMIDGHPGPPKVIASCSW